MKLRPVLLVSLLVSAIGGSLAYHRPSAPKRVSENAQPAAPIADARTATVMPAQTNELDATNSARVTALEEFLDQVIADAIQRGTLDPSRLTAKQLALLPAKFRPSAHSDTPELTPEEIAHVEQQIALGEDAPPDPPPQQPCPDPNHLPENYNNAYNKMILRERGCRL